MAYEKTNWINGVTPTSAENLNKIEDELESLDINKADKSTTYDKTSIDEALEQLRTGWNILDAILTYSSWDSEVSTAVVNTNIDLTGTIELGDRLKFTQDGTVKYGIVTVKASTQLTLFLGTDYVLTNTSITDVYFSHMKTPYGLPMDPDKWSISVSADVEILQNNPEIGTYYNFYTISIPIGSWKASITGNLAVVANVNVNLIRANITLSTANNTKGDNGLTCFVGLNGYQNATYNIATLSQFYREKLINLTSKTNYFLNASVVTGSCSSINLVGNQSRTEIKAVCAYL